MSEVEPLLWWWLVGVEVWGVVGVVGKVVLVEWKVGNWRLSRSLVECGLGCWLCLVKFFVCVCVVVDVWDGVGVGKVWLHLGCFVGLVGGVGGVWGVWGLLLGEGWAWWGWVLWVMCCRRL